MFKSIVYSHIQLRLAAARHQWSKQTDATVQFDNSSTTQAAIDHTWYVNKTL